MTMVMTDEPPRSQEPTATHAEQAVPLQPTQTRPRRTADPGTDRSDADMPALPVAVRPARLDPDSAPETAAIVELRLPHAPPPIRRQELPPVRMTHRPVSRPRQPRPRERGTELSPAIERLGATMVASYRHPRTTPGQTRSYEEHDALRPANRAAAAMDPRLACCMLATAAVEVIAGTRPVAQLARWVTPSIYDALIQRRLLGGGAGDGAPMPALARAVTGVPRPSVQRVRAMRVSDHIVESSVVLRHADRVRAVAIRLVEVRGCWRAEALVVG